MLQRCLQTVALSALLGGCAIIRLDVADLGPTLADLEPVELPAARTPVAAATLAEIEANYRAALEVTRDPDLRQEIEVRLADVEMARGEHNQLAEVPQPQNFDSTISQYNRLLEDDQQPLSEATDERLLYRLAKAYALDGRMVEADATLARLVTRYPDSVHALEARFRMAEHAFSQGDYEAAQRLYTQVVEAGAQSPYHINAQYMLGWSMFKANRFRASLTPFTGVLDTLLPADGQLDSLKEADRALATDTLRVMGITFSYLDGAEAIAEVYQDLGERHYQHLLYQQLGDFYLEKERYGDAAQAFNAYTDAFPRETRASDFALRRLDVLSQGGLSEEVLAGKEHYVERFGPRSAYWADLSEQERTLRIKPSLQTFLDELSSFHHAKAQALQAAAADFAAKPRAGLKPPPPATPSFRTAAGYYQQFLEVFTDDPSLPEKQFLMAEALVEAGELERAVTVYEEVAFTRLDPNYGARAGYNVIVVLDQLYRQAGADAAPAWRAKKVDAAITFADFYPADPKAPEVLAEAAETLFAQNLTERAYPLAVRLSQWHPAPAPALQKTAWLMIAHILFDRQQYEQAEAAYREVLARTDTSDPERAPVVERIAASMFQAAGLKLAGGDTEAALDQYLAINDIAPGTDIARKAHYDAGNILMEQQAWQRAERLFADFERRYPNDPLTQTLPAKFALIYQELELWGEAALSLQQMAAGSNDPQTQRQSMYLAAELYQKSGRIGDARDAYRAYLKAYPQPFDLATEARYQMLETAPNAKERNDWLNRLVAADAQAGNATTERARYLAAYAASQLALQSFEQFEAIKLTLPIKTSFARKRAALERTLDAYKKVIDYGVGEYVTEANYRIGNVYSQLSRDLLDSQRPEGLDDLAMEQYEILLEEQAYPFEDKSIELLAANAERAWDGFYDDWVKRSLNELAKLLPARYGKKEHTLEVADGLL